MTLQLQQDGATTLFRSRITDSASFIIKLPMAIFSFLLGLVVGSFINVVIRRGEKGEKLTGRSHCESCGKMLSFLELIPVLSYLVLRGRCRNCNAPFSLQYPLVELGTGILYATVAWYLLGSSGNPVSYLETGFPSAVLVLFLAFVALGAAIVIFVSDIRSHIIPNGAVLTLLVLGFFRLVYVMSQTKSSTIVLDLVWDTGAALAIALFLAALWHFSGGRWMGFGDVKLIFATSLILGFPAAFVAFLLAFWLGGLLGIILIVSRQKTLQGHIPFGPFILAGAVLTYFLPPDNVLIRSLNDIIFLWRN